MARTLDANQIPKYDRPYVQPIYLIHLLLSGLTLYFSDRNYTYNSHNYEDYLFDLSDIGSAVRNLGGYENSRLTLRFKNDPIRDQNTLIDLFDDYPPEKRYVEIYKLLINTDETFVSDVSTEIFKGEMGQPYDITDPAIDFKIDVSSMLHGKRAALPLDVIDLADFPSADPDDVGKYRNRIIGSNKKVICPWTVAGWLSTLTTEITAAATSIVVTDSNGAPATPFTTFIDNEEVRVTGNTKATGTLTVTRGYNSTTAVIHNKGASIYEKRADFEAEVAMHPVKTIGDVYVKRGSEEWLRVVSGVTKNASTGGRATLVFSDKVKYEEKTNVIPSTDTGTHIHTASLSALATKTCVPTGATGGTNPTNAIDGDELSVASIGAGQGIAVTFTETDLGTVNKQYLWILCSGTVTISCPSGTSLGSFVFSSKSWKRIVKTGGAWANGIDITNASGGASLYEVYKEVEYTPAGPTIDTHPADGVTTTLAGNSVANMMIGDLIACDVDGMADDVSGTYTGTGSALIERPDHVRKYILMGLLGFVAGDIGASFGTVGTTYAGRIAGGYKFAFVMHEVATETADLFERMDLHSRSNMFESGGAFQLAFGSTSDPTSQKIFDRDNIKGPFTFSKTEVADIRNTIRGHYFRDYSKSGSIGERCQKVNEKVNAASVTKYGALIEDIEFSCIGDLSLMVDDVLDWILLEKHDLKKIVKFLGFWEAEILEACDYFTVNTVSFWTGFKYKTIKWIEHPAEQTIEIEGLEFISS